MNPVIIITSVIVAVIFTIIALIMNKKQSRAKQATLKNLINDRRVETSTIYQDDNETSEQDEKTKHENDNKQFKKKLKNSNGEDVYVDGLNPKSVRYLLIQAGLETPVFMFWIYSAISCAIVFAITKFMMNLAPLVVILLTFTGFFGLPRFILKKKVARRQQKFLEEFADCLEAMIRLLKSGMPISEAIAMTAREYDGPIGEEMTKVYEAQRVGDTLPEAVEKLAFRVPMPEVKMFATAITIQTQTGSSLSEVLENLANVIRQRFKLKRKVQALSAEAKISAAIIGCLPVVVIGGMYFTNPDYISQLWLHSTGKTLMYISLGWMSVGIFIMKQMINFKI